MGWRRPIFLPLRSQSLARSSGKPAAIDLAFALRLRLELGTRLFHSVEKSFPWCGKLLREWGAAAEIFPRCGKKFSIVWKTFGATGARGAVFSTVWKLFFHSVENGRKTFPWHGK
jgi:hypothetical protein